VTAGSGHDGRQGDDPVIGAAVAGDEGAFSAVVERHRRELRVHCYRMLGSFTDAEDLVQETFLRAWRRRDTFQGRSTFRAWLYRIATNACLDFLDHAARRPALAARPGHDSPAEVPWLEPYPEHLLELAGPDALEPAAVVVAKETIELAFLTAIQLLPPMQRAVLIMRGILEWPAADTAQALDTTVAAVNSSLQRAREALQRQRPAAAGGLPQPSTPSRTERELLARYIDAHEQADPQAVIELLREDVRCSMPPLPVLYDGRQVVTTFFRDTFALLFAGDLRLVPTRANHQPAAGIYQRADDGSGYRPLCLDVLRVEAGQLVEVVTFEPRLFPAFGLPEQL
jgi:RNA polymerase sigma-70 factor (ECF subfamily)